MNYDDFLSIYTAMTSTSPISEPSSTILIEPSSSIPITETTTFSNVRLTSHLPPLRPTTISSNQPTELPKPSEKPKEPIESPKPSDNPLIDPRITLSGMSVNEYLVHTIHYDNIYTVTIAR